MFIFCALCIKYQTYHTMRFMQFGIEKTVLCLCILIFMYILDFIVDTTKYLIYTQDQIVLI